MCGPNCDGIVALHDRAALWGDALVPREAGHVAVVSQSGNVAVNALAARRGLRLHTVVSCGNQAVVDAGDWLHALAAARGRALGRALPGERRRRRAPVRGAARCAPTPASASRCSRSAPRPRARAPPPRTPARWPATTPPSARWCRRPARRGRRTSTTCSSWPRRSRCAARARAATAGWPSSPARAATRGSAPTRRSAAGSSCPRCSPTRPSACARCCRRRPPSPTRSTTRRSSGARSRRCAT